jgi:hypothetical protein
VLQLRHELRLRLWRTLAEQGTARCHWCGRRWASPAAFVPVHPLQLACLNCAGDDGEPRPAAAADPEGELAHDLRCKLARRACVDCGWAVTARNSQHHQWDHILPATKRHNVFELVREAAPRELADRERAKCALRCRACHRVRTHAQRGSQQ